MRLSGDDQRFNEHLRLTATFMNTCGAATIVGAVIVPFTRLEADPDQNRAILIFVALCLHLVGQMVLSYTVYGD